MSQGMPGRGGLPSLKVETRIERRSFRTSCPTAPACKVTDRYVNQEAAHSSLTPQALYGRAFNAGPPRDTCRPGPNPKPPNRPLTCTFSRGAGRT
jgi:hypothetical protein